MADTLLANPLKWHATQGCAHLRLGQCPCWLFAQDVNVEKSFVFEVSKVEPREKPSSVRIPRSFDAIRICRLEMRGTLLRDLVLTRNKAVGSTACGG